METIDQYTQTLTENARALISATSGAAEDKIKEARKHLSNALENGREIYDQVRERTKFADDAVRENPYAAVGIAVIIGAILAFLLTRRSGE